MKIKIISLFILLTVAISSYFFYNNKKDHNLYEKCSVEEVLKELKADNINYVLPKKEEVPLDNVLEINLKSVYYGLHSHAITHAKGERAGDFIKDRCRFLVEMSLPYRINDNNFTNNFFSFKVVNNKDFTDFNTEITINGKKRCLGFALKSNVEDFLSINKDIVLSDYGCSEFLKKYKILFVEGFNYVIYPKK